MDNIWEVSISFKTKEDNKLMNWQEERLAVKAMVKKAFKSVGVEVSVDEIREA